jgi:competence protein ComEA
MDNIREYLKEHQTFITIAICLIFILIVGIYLYFQRLDLTGFQSTKDTDYQSEGTSDNNIIYVDISGQIINPGVYEVNSESRIKDVIDMAGGFTQEADQDYISQSLNQAALVTDGQKIYIPCIEEKTSQEVTPSLIKGMISINSGSKSELESLSGIGEKRSQSIIDARPYSSIEELVSRKIISQSLFNEIKDKITL